MMDTSYQQEESGRRIRRQRLNKGMTQADLARELNYHPYTISQWEIGKQGVHPHRLKVLADFFDVSIAYLRADDMEGTDGGHSGHDL